MGDRGTPAARHLRDLARWLRCRPAPRLANPPGPHYPPLTGTPAVAEPVGRSASWRGFGYLLSPLPVVRPTPAALTTARRWFKRSAGNTPPRNTYCRTIPCTLNACMRGAIEYQASRRRLVLQVIRASHQALRLTTGALNDRRTHREHQKGPRNDRRNARAKCAGESRWRADRDRAERGSS